MGIGCPGCPLYLLFGSMRRAVSNVLGNREGEQERLLQHKGYLLPEAAQLDICYIMPIYEHGPAPRVEQSSDKGGESALTGTGWADNSHSMARLNVKGKLCKDRNTRLIAESDIIQEYLPLYSLESIRPRLALYLFFGFQYLHNALAACCRVLHCGGGIREGFERCVQRTKVGQKDEHAADGQLSVERMSGAYPEDGRRTNCRHRSHEDFEL